MPNFWTSTTQKIAEAFNGPRTRDVEFDQKVDDMKIVEKSIVALKSLFQNFVNYTSGIKSFSRDFSNSNKIIFDKSSSYGALGNDICECHFQIEKSYEELLTSVNEINLATSQWSTMFTQAKQAIQKKEDSRKVYDHYDEKMEKIYKNRQEKVKKNGSETPKEYELILRNEQKYKKATEEYIGLSVTAYDFMTDALDCRYEMINPIVGKFVEYENKFYHTVFNSFRTLENMDYKFKQAAKKYVKSENTYDPTKYIRGGDLIKHDDNNAQEQSKPEIKPRSKSNLPDRTQQQSTNTVKKKEISEFDQIENQFSHLERKPNSYGKQTAVKQQYEEPDQTEANDNINNPYAQININSNINYSQNKYQQQSFNKRSSTPNQMPVNDNFDFNQFNKVNSSNSNNNSNNNFNNTNNSYNNNNNSNNFDLLSKNTNTNSNKNPTPNYNFNNNASSSFNQGFGNNNNNQNNPNNNQNHQNNPNNNQNHQNNQNNQNNFDFGLMDLANPTTNNIQKNINTVNSGLSFYQNNQSQIHSAAKNANNMNNNLNNCGITTGIPTNNPINNSNNQNNKNKSDNDIFQDFFK